MIDLKARLLRIGNNVRYEHGPIITIGIHDLYRLHDKYIKLNPIILDEKRLTQLGFNKLDKYTFVNRKMFVYHRKRGFTYGSKKREVNLKYVHQLQNLFFSLTGNELKLNIDL